MLGTTNVPALIPESLSISLNGTNSLVYDGTSSKSLNITAASIGAAAASHNHDSVYSKLSHTHNYAGSSSAGGNANAAVKLATARKIGDASFDGTANITLSQMGASPAAGSASLKYLASTITLGSGDGATILQDGSTYNQKIEILDNAKENDEVFVFSQSSDKGVNWTQLFSILDNGTISAKQFTGNSATATKLATARKIGNATFDGTADITVAAIGAAAASHNHDSVYAKTSHTHTKAQITDFPTSLPNAGALTISLNGTSQGAYNGSAAKAINITAASVGAAAASHTHNYAGSSSAGGNANAAVKLATARKIGNIAFDGTADITIAQIGAAAASHNHDSVYAKLSHTHTKSQITDFPTSLPANGGTADYAKYLKSNLIPDDSDLNNYTTPGFYHCPSNESAATLKNCPTGNAFFLIVGSHAGSYQHIVEYMTSSPKNFFRNKHETTWSSWFREYTTINKPTPAELGAAATSHTHTKSQISDFPASLKNPTGIVIKLNGGTTEGTNMFTYDGSAAKSLNITAALVGAAASSHTHNYAGSSSAGGNANAAVKLATARKIGNASFDGTANITIAQIGAAAASHTHTKAQITDFPASLKNPTAMVVKLNGGTTEGTNMFTYDGSAAKSLNITAASIGAAASSHNHDSVYAKLSHTHTKSQITDFPASLKNPTALTISLNGTSQGAYDGSAAKAINITPAAISAAPKNLVFKAVTIKTTDWVEASKNYTYANASITANHSPMVNFSKATLEAAGKAGIIVYTEAGKMILEYTTKPTADLVIDAAILIPV